MNEKNFHKLIEKNMTAEELEHKKQVLEKIHVITDCKSKEKSKSKNCFKAISIAASIVLISIMVPISILLINNNQSNLIEAGVSNNSAYQGASKTTDIYTSSETSNRNEQVETEVPQDCCEGLITVSDNKKYFDSINGLYHKEILSSIKIEDYETGIDITVEDITLANKVFALIITNENKQNYPEYQVGDMIKLIVK